MLAVAGVGIFGIDQRHGFSPRRLRRGCARRQGHRDPLSKEPLRIGWMEAICAVASRRFQPGDIGQDALDRFTFGGPERGLRRQRIADGIALDLQAGLDAGG